MPRPSWSVINTHFARNLNRRLQRGRRVRHRQLWPPWRHCHRHRQQVREYDEGSLTIDLVDADSAALLWRGTGTQRFREYKDPEKASRDINTLVEKILAQFPPRSPVSTPEVKAEIKPDRPTIRPMEDR
jgi:hypothetical protein